MDDQFMLSRVEALIQKGEAVLATRQAYVPGHIEPWVSSDLFIGWRAQTLVFLSNLPDTGRHYQEAFDTRCRIAGAHSTSGGVSILRSLREDLEGGFLISLRELIHASLFDDFLAMSEHLVKDGGFKDAAAVLAGSTLEEHLRKLCDKHSIPTTTTKPNGRTEPKKASVMNNDLKQGSVFTQIDWRSVLGWLDLRNDAAHGDYANYTQSQVELMVDGIRNFIARNPA